MDYMEEPWNKMPFYMTYSLQDFFENEMEYEKDMQRMREMYPEEVKKLLELIEKRCDELEYEGSRIYDEEPDCVMIRREIQQLYEKLRDRFEDNESQMPTPGMQPVTGSEPMPKMQPVPGREPMPGMQPEQGQMPMMQIPSDAGQATMPMMQPDVLSSMSVGSRDAFYPPEGFLPPGYGQRQNGRRRPDRWPEDNRDYNRRERKCNGWFCDLVGVLFYDELFRRRARHRRGRRFW